MKLCIWQTFEEQKDEKLQMKFLGRVTSPFCPTPLPLGEWRNFWMAPKWREKSPSSACQELPWKLWNGRIIRRMLELNLFWMQLWFRAGKVMNFSSMGNGMKGLEHDPFKFTNEKFLKPIDFSPLSFLYFLLAFAFEVLGFLINRFLIYKNECILRFHATQHTTFA